VGTGTINSHWREAVLRNELMTGYLNSGENPLSVLTVASLKDLGYVVDEAKADFFFVQTNLMAGAGLQAMDQGIHLKDDYREGADRHRRRRWAAGGLHALCVGEEATWSVT